MEAEQGGQSVSDRDAAAKLENKVTFHRIILLVDIPSIMEKYQCSKHQCWHPFVQHTDNLG